MNTYVITADTHLNALYFNYYIKAASKSRVIEWANKFVGGNYTIYELSDYNNLLKDIENKAIEI